MRVEETSLVYLAPGDVLKGRVEPTIWMRMCDSFAQMGLNVELVSLYAYRRENIHRKQIFAHYGIPEPNFKLTILPTPMTPTPPIWWSQTWTSGLNSVYSLWQSLKANPANRLVFYSRSPAAIYPYWFLQGLFRGKKRPLLILETHALLTGNHAQNMLKRVDGIVVSSQKLATDMTTQLNVSHERLQVAYLAPNALPLHIDRETACRELNLPPDKNYIVYTGKLLMAEVEMILETANLIASALTNVEFLIVGGNPEILATCRAEQAKRNLHNVQFIGFVSPAHIVFYQLVASILFVYLDGNRNLVTYITPSKIFDYLQAGRPIIASDYPILHEILNHEKNALLIEPGSPVALAEAIRLLLRDQDLANRLSQQALEDSQQYTWEQRVRLIWDFIQRVDKLVP